LEVPTSAYTEYQHIITGFIALIAICLNPPHPRKSAGNFRFPLISITMMATNLSPANGGAENSHD
jgi:hypothetical protein